jgi:hypothetical protein
MASLMNSTNVQRKINANPSQTFPKNCGKGTHPNLIYKARLKLIPQPEKDTTSNRS